MAEALVNGVSSTLNGAITNSQTTITIASADASKFPATGNYRLAVTDNTNTELMLVTAGQGTATLTVTRAAETYNGAATGYAFASGSTVAQVVTAASLTTGLGPIKYAEVVLASAQASVTLPVTGTLPQNYRNIRLLIDARSDQSNATGDPVICRFNGDTAANYDWLRHQATGTVVQVDTNLATGSPQIGFIPGTGAPSGVSGGFEMVVFNYSGTTFQKRLRILGDDKNLNGTASGNIYLTNFGGWWRNTAAITSLTLLLNSGGNFIAGSTFTLYLEP